ncbi:uncharacterized protein CIMG_02272 [Coccidioides immitis RS]|uniref:Uncharacterized protein n=3 Tax=Coccidioides immitis TaxID=5501 RepID=J3KL04_COCIM|nr:uncharacterized protein CIMG_02272 [Coccidioides immitis RS]EAS36918.3 hypothetical protein CIMG_02272 [Coccidioides immitis RS]KMP09828.1 hypothetical protein CIRG_09061 [Coccidioides immitis RMSCC 2394]KMU81284.1 hypothetical protein CISG_02661 [Coccidioides immitis RMSCC 3703]TPX25031.1 hypothetical protein DIZ76_010480 [Coccidioides immitis]
MSFPPKYAGLKLFSSGITEQRHTLEIYLDYVCPYSAKFFDTFYNSVIPIIRKKYRSYLQVIFRPQVQPWHPSSTLTQEAALVVLKLEPSKFWDFSEALFKAQKEYFDVNVVNETRNHTYKRLAALASKVTGLDEGEVYWLLKISDRPGPDGSLNTGNQVTNDIKFLTKSNRVVGAHVTPTVFFDGIEERSIDSKFTPQQWEEWLEKSVV